MRDLLSTSYLFFYNSFIQHSKYEVLDEQSEIKSKLWIYP